MDRNHIYKIGTFECMHLIPLCAADAGTSVITWATTIEPATRTDGRANTPPGASPNYQGETIARCDLRHVVKVPSRVDQSLTDFRLVRSQQFPLFVGTAQTAKIEQTTLKAFLTEADIQCHFGIVL